MISYLSYQAQMAQWYGAGLEILFPSGSPGSIPGLGVCAIEQSEIAYTSRIEPWFEFTSIHQKFLKLLVEFLGIKQRKPFEFVLCMLKLESQKILFSELEKFLLFII